MEKKMISMDYLAGIIDGEGYVGIRKCNTKNDGSLIPEYKPNVVVSNTNYDLMKSLKNNFSGSICRKKSQEGWKQGYSFEFNRTTIKDILPKLINKLIIKRKQAEMVLKLFQTYKHTHPKSKYSSKEIKEKERLHKLSLSLNKRGNNN